LAGSGILADTNYSI